MDPCGTTISGGFNIISDFILETPAEADCSKRWLFHRWQSLSSVRRWFYTKLIAKADMLTVLPPENLKVARALFTHVRSEFVLFGINADEFASVKKEKVHDPVRILSLGNDPHRDCQVLVRAIKDFSACYLKIISLKLNKKEIKKKYILNKKEIYIK